MADIIMNVSTKESNIIKPNTIINIKHPISPRNIKAKFYYRKKINDNVTKLFGKIIENKDEFHLIMNKDFLKNQHMSIGGVKE